LGEDTCFGGEAAEGCGGYDLTLEAGARTCG
jgi:hypothetical protein